jgi:hypothetical protein
MTHKNEHSESAGIASLAPTTAREQLPTLAAVQELGLTMDLDEARLVLTVLSNVIGRGRSKTRGKTGQMLAGLVACCRVEGFRDGAPVAAAHPELAPFGWPAGATAMRRLGIDARDIETLSVRNRQRRATDACLPLAWVLAFVPAPFWEPALTLIKWGPAEAAMRLEDAVIELAQQPIAIPNRRRPTGSTLSAGTIHTRVTGIHEVFQVLWDLRLSASTSPTSALPMHLLEPWAFKPERPDIERCGGKEAQVETAGPSFEEIRDLLDRLDRDVRLAPRRSRYLRLRRRAIAGLLCIHGQRVEAVHRLNVDDYRPEHNFGDGTKGPAIVYRPGKTRSRDEVHILAVPAELARWIEEWILYTGRSIGEPNSPVWPAKKPGPGAELKRLNESAFGRSIAGYAAKDGTGSLPLLPRKDDRYHGFNPHAYRHTAYQVARRAGAYAKLEEPHQYAEVTADDFARAVVGYELVRGVGDVYRDLKQEHLARVAIERAWLELRARPVVHGPDPEAITDAAEIVELRLRALRELAEELGALEQRQLELARQRLNLTGPELDGAALESNTLVFELARLQSEAATATRRLTEARDRLEAVLAADVPIEVKNETTYALELERARMRAASILAEDPFVHSIELTVKDVAEVLDVCPQTVNAWIRRGFPRDRKVLWVDGAWTSDDRGVRCIQASQIDRDALTAIEEEWLALVCTRRARGRRTNAA